jgi:two-component system response regulator PilR (NtrC family)
MKSRILVVDDEESIREFLEIMLKKEGYEVTIAEDGLRAKEILAKKSFDMVISDMQMPNMTGIELLKHVKESYPDLVFMMITAFGTTETAVDAMKMGAYDYVTKPFKIDEVRLNIANALRSKNLETEVRVLKKELVKEYSFQNMIGNSAPMHAIFDLVKRVSQAPTNVMITGESGTGKEVVAKAIHYNGLLKDKPFVTINCGAIPENLMESEMFGHKKGSFTGAITDKSGLFEVADGGTLFLDEVGELPVSIQVKLLRAIQERVIRRVGAIDDIKIEVRIIAATNRNLEDMVAKGTFRQDLFYRLNVIGIRTPSLRERAEDVPLLANFFLRKYNEKLNTNISTIPHMRNLFNCEVGLSDHTMGVGVSVASVALGASVIEKHFTLNRKDGGVDSAFSLEPYEFSQLVTETQNAWLALGHISYGATKAEEKSLQFRRSLYIVQDLKAGETLTNENVRAIRPGFGLHTKYLDYFIGKEIKSDAIKGTPLKFNLI